MDNVMKKVMQLAQHQLGMPKEQAYCEHKWKMVSTHRLTFQPKERICIKCFLKQYAKLVWSNNE